MKASASEIAGIVRDALLAGDLEAAARIAAEHPRVTFDPPAEPGLMFAIHDGPTDSRLVHMRVLGCIALPYECLPAPTVEGVFKLELRFPVERLGHVRGFVVVDHAGKLVASRFFGEAAPMVAMGCTFELKLEVGVEHVERIVRGEPTFDW